MKIVRLNYRNIALAVLVMFAVSVQAQNYGALQYMLQKRPANEKFKSNKFNEHLFFSAGLGAHTLLTNHGNQDGLGMEANAYMGKWLTPVHGLRAGLGLGYFPSNYFAAKAKMAKVGMDYILNMSALAYGYNEDRFFDLMALAGFEAGYSRATPSVLTDPLSITNKHEFFYGVRMGLQANFRLYRTLDFFVEPTLGWYSDGYGHSKSWRRYKMRGALMMGLTYMPSAPMGDKIHFDAFDNSHYINHSFVSVSAGLGMLKVPGIINTLKGLGPHVSAGVGKWFTPLHAVRLSGTLGYSDTPSGSVSRNFKHLDLHADYMLDVNTLLWGYDEERLFTLAGVAGLNLAVSKGVEPSVKVAPGFGVGIQGSFRLNPSVDLFVEPRLNIYQKNYAGGRGFGGKTDQFGEINVGLTYHAAERAKLPKSSFSKQHIADNLFMTSGIGMQMFFSKTNLQNLSSLGPQASASVGKWLTPYSGVRLVGSGGFYRNYAEAGNVRHLSVTGGADYLWNITSTMSGYNPNRIFELIASAGFHLAYTSQSAHSLQPGLNAGIQALWHVNDFLGLYIEPQIRLYSDKYIEGNLGFWSKDMLAGFNAGFHYRFVPYSKAANRGMFDKDAARYFISGAMGVGSLLVANRELINNAGIMAKGGVGKWISPLFAWRLSGTILYKSKAPNKIPLHYAGVGLDYMMSLGTLAKGYNADPVIDVLPFVSVNGGLARRIGKFKFIPGFDAGVQVKLKLTSAFYLFAEPQLGIRSDAYDGIEQGNPDRVASMVGGLLLKFKMPTFNY